MQKGSEFEEKAANTQVGRDVTGEKKGKAVSRRDRQFIARARYQLVKDLLEF